MRYCVKCGKEIVEGAAFCAACGAPVEVQPVALVAAPSFEDALVREEREFLENTYNLLRWELKAWSIASKVFIIVGIVYAAFFTMFSFIGAIGGGEVGAAFTVIGFFYAILFGGMFVALGIVNKKAAEKLPLYINTVYTDISVAYNRCGNIGMLIFSVLLGAVSAIFFVINFVRMKTNRAVIERIMRNQNVQG